jgi:hypothetical protein
MARALHSFVRKFPHYALQGGNPVTKEQALQSFERNQIQVQPGITVVPKA